MAIQRPSGSSVSARFFDSAPTASLFAGLDVAFWVAMHPTPSIRAPSVHTRGLTAKGLRTEKLKPADVAWLIACFKGNAPMIPSESSDRLTARGFIEHRQGGPRPTEMGRQWLVKNGHLASHK